MSMFLSLMLSFSQCFCILSIRVPKAARRTPCDWARFLLLLQFSSTLWSIQIVDFFKGYVSVSWSNSPEILLPFYSIFNDCQFFLECVSTIFHWLFHPTRSASVSVMLTELSCCYCCLPVVVLNMLILVCAVLCLILNNYCASSF